MIKTLPVALQIGTELGSIRIAPQQSGLKSLSALRPL